MSFRRVLALVAAMLAATGSAQAICTANEIIALEQFCPAGTGPCLIDSNYTVEDGCTLDFGQRAVTLQLNNTLSMGSNAFTLKAGTLTLNGNIRGVGNATGARGGMVVLETTGNVTVSGSSTIDVSGNRSAGDIIIRAGESVVISGKLRARELNAGASGGLITITAGGNIETNPSSQINAQGGIDSDGGGEIDLIAGGDMTLRSNLNVFGFDGGFIILEAGGKAIMEGADVSGRGDAGSGGCLDLLARRGAEVRGTINATGATGLFMTGGCGGLICVDGGRGEVRLAASAVINANGASPDGGGGQVSLLSEGDVVVAGTLLARGPTGETCGGDVCVDAGYDISVPSGSLLDVSGGDAGGDLELAAGRNLTVDGQIDADGRQSGSLGGDVTLRAAAQTSGTMRISGRIDVSSDAACSLENGCGQGGIIELAGCNLTLTGALDVTGPDAGANLITARDQLTSTLGRMDAARTVGNGTDGLNRIVHRIGRAPVLNVQNIDPPASLLAVATCPNTGETEPPCLNPCPVCGDGQVSFPEMCDPGVIPPMGCGGCSAFCRPENCDDGLTCTADSCDPVFGCLNELVPECQEPTATVTGTPPTATATPTPSATATATTTGSHTGTATPGPSFTQTPPATETSTAMATATATAPSTPTQTASAEPTETPPPGCAGDCNGRDGVTVNELIMAVNIALGNTGASACPAVDRDGNGAVSISELIAAVNSALAGC